MRVDCPHCATKAAVLTSRKISPTLREAYAVCRNPTCGWTGAVNIAVVRTISQPPVSANQSATEPAAPTGDLFST